MVQTSWDLTKLETPANVPMKAMVVMHMEKFLGVRGKKKHERNMAANKTQDHEDVHLKHIVQPKPRDTAQPKKEEAQLTAAELAEKETEPVRWHFCVMQKDHLMDQVVYQDDFRKYLMMINPGDCRPYGLHQVNCFAKRAIKTKFQMLSGGEAQFDFAAWKKWWEESANSEKRTNWDGGVKMEHLQPPGKQSCLDV